jgi:hypothetical protein
MNHDWRMTMLAMLAVLLAAVMWFVVVYVL